MSDTLDAEWMRKYCFPYEKTNDEAGRQKKLIEQICKAAENRETLLVNASTGIGKTISVVASAFALITRPGSGINRVIICPSNKSQHDNILKEIRMVQEKYPEHAWVPCIALKGKNDLCNNSEMHEGGEIKDFDLPAGTMEEVCKYLRKKGKCKYYARLKELIEPEGEEKGTEEYRRLEAQNAFNLYMQYDVNNQPVCQYYLRAIAARGAAILVADYNYVLKEEIARAIDLDGQITDTLLVFDEAHNLVSRSVGNLSDRKSKKSFDGTVEILEQLRGPGENDQIDSVAWLLEQLGEYLAKDAMLLTPGEQKPFDFNALLAQIGVSRENIELAINCLEEHMPTIIELTEGGRNYSFAMLNFLKTLHGNAGKREYVTYLERSWNGAYASYVIQCLDPSLSMQRLVEAKVPMVLMSGTMKPFEYYRDVLGLPNGLDRASGTQVVSHEADFLKKNRLIVYYSPEYADFRSKERGNNKAEKVADVAFCINTLPGNTANFFQSFAVANEYGGLLEGKTKKKLLVHTQEEERDIVYREFIKSRNAVLNTVAGSALAEGVDYPGETLMNAVIIGVPFGARNLLALAQEGYYAGKFGAELGRFYSYICPTLVRIQQAAGRVVRGPGENGLIILYGTGFDRLKGFPPEYLANQVKSKEELAEVIKRFWEGKQ